MTDDLRRVSLSVWIIEEGVGAVTFPVGQTTLIVRVWAIAGFFGCQLTTTRLRNQTAHGIAQPKRSHGYLAET